MPHSVSLPFTTLLSSPSATEPSYKTLLPRDELRQVLLRALGNNEAKLEEVLQGKKQVVNSCGSGMTAGVIWLALSELGVKSAIYDEVKPMMLTLGVDRAAPRLMHAPRCPDRAGQDTACGRKARSWKEND